MKKKFANKLEEVVVKLINSKLSKFNLSNNFKGVACDIYPSEYGLVCHITFVMKNPFSRKESDFFNQFMTYEVKKNINNSLGNLFKDISSQQSTDDVYNSTKWWYESKKEEFE
jgi:hypothetical protein